MIGRQRSGFAGATLGQLPALSGACVLDRQRMPSPKH